MRVGSGGIDGLAREAEMSKQTLHTLFDAPNPLKAGRVETREKVAMTLRFRDWGELVTAYERDDILYGLAWVRISPVAFADAKRLADLAEMRVEDWVTELIAAEVAGAAAKK